VNPNASMMFGASLDRDVNFSGSAIAVGDGSFATSSVQFGTDGAIAYGGEDSLGSTRWHDPLTPGIGNSRWIKATLDGGSAPSSGPAMGAISAMSAARTWTLTRSGVGTAQSQLSVTIYADAAGSIPVCSGPMILRSTVSAP
jgi:hypothetical protein